MTSPTIRPDGLYLQRLTEADRNNGRQPTGVVSLKKFKTNSIARKLLADYDGAELKSLYWYASFSSPGSMRKRKSLQVAWDLPELAVQQFEIESKRFQQARLGHVVADGSMTVIEFLTNYMAEGKARKATSSQTRDAQALGHFFGLKLEKKDGTWSKKPNGGSADITCLREIQPYQLMRFRSHRIGTDEVKPQTIHRDEIAIYAALNWAVTRKLIESNPFRDIPKVKPDHDHNSKQPEHLTEDEITVLLRACQEPVESGKGAMQEIKTPIHEMVAVAAYAGLRVGEVLALDWEDLFLDGDQPYLWVRNKAEFRTKSRKDRRIPFVFDELTEILLAYQKAKKKEGRGKTGPVFATRTGTRYTRTNVSGVLRNVGKRLVKAKKLKKAPGWNILRHSFGTMLAHLGTSAFDLREYMGHSSVRVTEQYYVAVEGDRLFQTAIVLRKKRAGKIIQMRERQAV